MDKISIIMCTSCRGGSESVMPNVIHDVLIPVIMVIGPVLGYIPQYWEIKRTRNYRAFSPLVSLILLVSNILRVFFW